jgi:succinylglutamate desuccinylase
MIAAGIHGDEPAGVEAALRFAESAVRDESLLSNHHFVIFPCNNPTGYELGIRENWKGIDLNRQFNVRKPEPEVLIVMNAIQGRCFDLVVEMHEDIDGHSF